MDYNTYEDTVRRSMIKNSLGSRTIIITQHFQTDISTLWDALTSPKRLTTWYAPVAGDLRVNGWYSIMGNASGTITACNEPHDFALTWVCGESKSTLAINLASIDGSSNTKLTLQHVLDADDHWRMYGPGATGVGWDMSLLGLILHIKGLPKPSEEEWMASHAASEFTVASGSAWAREAERAGEDQAWAKEAEERTTMFYRPGWRPGR